MKPKEVARLYLQRHNAHDVEGVLALFADDAEFEIPGRLLRRGKEEIRVTEEWEALVHDNIQAPDLVEADNEVTFRAFEANDWLSAAGVRQLRYTSVTIAVEGDRIKRITAAISPESWAALQPVA